MHRQHGEPRSNFARPDRAATAARSLAAESPRRRGVPSRFARTLERYTWFQLAFQFSRIGEKREKYVFFSVYYIKKKKTTYFVSIFPVFLQSVETLHRKKKKHSFLGHMITFVISIALNHLYIGSPPFICQLYLILSTEPCNIFHSFFFKHLPFFTYY